MNTDFIIFVLSLVMLFLGWGIAYIEYRRKYVKLLSDTAKEIIADRQRWYKYGVDDTLKDKRLIQKTCNEYFHTHNP